jgi:hypothetical protein
MNYVLEIRDNIIKSLEEIFLEEDISANIIPLQLDSKEMKIKHPTCEIWVANANINSINTGVVQRGDRIRFGVDLIYKDTAAQINAYKALGLLRLGFERNDYMMLNSVLLDIEANGYWHYGLMFESTEFQPYVAGD